MKLFIFGLGHLGIRVAKFASANFPFIYGTTTTKAKLNSLQSQGISPLQWKLGDPAPKEALEADHLVFCLPPKFRQDKGENYLHGLGKLLPQIKERPLVFISSTSVFGEQGVVDENTSPSPDTENGKVCLEAERMVEDLHPKASILRLAGLVDEQRHPANFFNRVPSPPLKRAPLNLIHSDDAAKLILALIERPQKFTHGVSPLEMDKVEFYKGIKKKWGREFNSSVEEASPQSKKIQTLGYQNLNYSPTYPNLFQYFTENSPQD